MLYVVSQTKTNALVAKHNAVTFITIFKLNGQVVLD
jgi:hypothetical protein